MVAIGITSCSVDTILGPQQIPAINPTQLAEDYTANLISMYQKSTQLNSRDLVDGGVEDFFNTLEIIGPDGTPLNFSDIENKDEFFELWKLASVEKIVDEYVDNVDLMSPMFIQNEAMKEILSENYAARSAVDINTAFFKALENKTKQYSLPSITAPTVNANSRAPGDATLAMLKQNYRWGRVLSTVGSSSSGSSAAITAGHASILTESDVWKPVWNNDSPIATSAWGSWFGDDFSKWNSEMDQVMKEPLGLWTNKITGNPMEDVRLSKVGIGVFSWGTIKFTEASSAEGQAAANYAISQIGKPYNFNLAWKFDTNSFYCTALVWRSWYSVNTKYDLDAVWVDSWVTATDIVNSWDSKTIKVTKN